MPLNALTTRPRGENIDSIRSLCRNAYLGGTDALTRVLGRYKMYVDTTDVWISSHLLLDGYWEIWVTEAIAELVKPGMVVADIGANLGYFTLLMAELVGPTGHVHSFEPNPVMLRRLRRNVTVNGFSGYTDVNDRALADVDGAIVSFHVPDENPGGAAITTHAHQIAAGAIQIETARLDSRPDWQAIELMKIDVEGAEELVWRGAQGLLEGDKLRTVLMEFNSERYADAPAFLAAMRSHGFSIGMVEPDRGMISVTEDVLLNDYANGEVMLLLQR
jgi:FkbM family methyltransferase